jgi:lipopolysaccharide transport protein LptA
MTNILKTIYFSSLFVLVQLTLISPSFAEKQTKEHTTERAMLNHNSRSGSPIFVKSDSLSVNALDRVFKYKDNVQIDQDDLRITANQVTGKYNENNQIETIICEGSVVITKGEQMRANSELAVYDVKTGIVDLTEGPEISQDGNVLTADKVLIYVDEDKSEAQGNVQVKVFKPTDGSQSPASLLSPVKSNSKDTSAVQKQNEDD